MSLESYDKVFLEIGCHPCIGGRQGGKIMQRPEELKGLIDWMQQSGIRKVLEIGCGWGSLSEFINRVLGCETYGITLLLDEMKDGTYKFPDCLKYINARSDSEEAFKFAEEHGPYDLIITDGEHSYVSAKNDYEKYKHLAKFMALADIESNNVSGPCQVYQEIDKSLKLLKIVAPHPTDSTYICGFGIVKGGLNA